MDRYSNVILSIANAWFERYLKSSILAPSKMVIGLMVFEELVNSNVYRTIRYALHVGHIQYILRNLFDILKSVRHIPYYHLRRIDA